MAAEILRHRYELSKVITDDEILDTYVLTNEDIRNEITEQCGVSMSNYHVAIGKLKKAGFLINGRINPKFIPKIEPGSDRFTFMLLFNFKDIEKDEAGV